VFNKFKVCYSICFVTFSVQETHHLQLLQGTEQSNYESLVLLCTVGIQDDYLETDVLLSRSALDPVYCLQVLQGLLGWN